MGLVDGYPPLPQGGSKSARVYSPERWRTFLAGLDHNVLQAEVLLCHLDERGFLAGGGVTIGAQVCKDDPSWAYLEPYHRESWLRSRANQQALLGYVRTVADIANPSFGQIGYVQSLHGTALETALTMIPDEELFKSRWRLRGYGWLTICSQRIGDELGGLHALRASGAFAEVAPLTAGGYWLLATPSYEEYDLAAAHRIFPVLAPKLPAGRPIGVTGYRSAAASPILLADQDAAENRTPPARDPTGSL